jgi:hypothetical protein
MSELKFGSEEEAMQHLSDITGKQVGVAADEESKIEDAERLKGVLNGLLEKRLNPEVIKMILGFIKKVESFQSSRTAGSEYEEDDKKRFVDDWNGMTLLKVLEFNVKDYNREYEEDEYVHDDVVYNEKDNTLSAFNISLDVDYDFSLDQNLEALVEAITEDVLLTDKVKQFI